MEGSARYCTCAHHALPRASSLVGGTVSATACGHSATTRHPDALSISRLATEAATATEIRPFIRTGISRLSRVNEQNLPYPAGKPLVFFTLVFFTRPHRRRMAFTAQP